jgi:SpoIID/LytB domain protein
VLEKNNSLKVQIYNIDENNRTEKFMEDVIEEILMSLDISFFHMEALKAHAIIIRTYLVRKMRIFGGMGVEYERCDITNREGEYVLKSLEEIKFKYNEEYDNVKETISYAVKSTKNKIITMNNNPIYPRFHETCGGATENSEIVGNHRIMYLRKVLCEYCTESPYYEEWREMSTGEFLEKLQISIDKSTPTSGPHMEGIIYDAKRDETGRIKSIKIGDKELKGIEVVEKLGINSTRFGWQPIKFKIYTRGKGHGLGLCQYGANKMATLGKNYEEIIKYYFTGIKIKDIEIPNEEKPLHNRVIVIDPGHGGESSEDNVGILGTREKDINLSIGMKLKKQLEQLGAKVIITREKDEYVSLSRRANISNEIMPDFFLSIHQKSFRNSNVCGSEIYIYRGDEESATLAELILKKLSASKEVVSRGVKIADFFLLREVRSSALQIEVGFITNEEEEKRLLNEEFQNTIGMNISRAMVEYYNYN